ncbi:hypothetical protein P6U16_22145 (plasmid) [Rhizobium sp. 32-5/1]|uniref:hypothetical protein n=1 Tax=Rhizobium sp. 32-5/1 TaxID=3019602 RepID=UPI00240CFFD3|nr:hypothetical protein [Rhizobium sp. 32-5/1]WEZ86129.1 hypothetical protein P6U16_22145 [Rhizobium sp. 32-5/1]
MEKLRAPVAVQIEFNAPVHHARKADNGGWIVHRFVETEIGVREIGRMDHP